MRKEGILGILDLTEMFWYDSNTRDLADSEIKRL